VRLYIDDDSVDPGLIRLLRRDGHDVEVPADVGLEGKGSRVFSDTYPLKRLPACSVENWQGLRY
jgi:hypothetical protein